MNDLEYHGSENGNAVLYFPHAGHDFYFEKHDHRKVTLKKVDPVDSVDQVWDTDANYEDLPKKVRAVLKQNGLKFRSRVSSAAEAMV